jgi:hypothetical protein
VNCDLEVGPATHLILEEYSMPESYGKRQRSQVKAKKATAREERRLARNQRKADREAGVLAPGPEEGPPNDVIEPEPQVPSSEDEADRKPGDDSV